jgi:para-aminobenzoate synthetase component 1
MFMCREEAVCKINEYASSRTAFLFITDFEGENTAVLKPEEAAAKGILFDTWRMRDPRQQEFTARPYSFLPKVPDFESYRWAFDKVSWHLRRGDTYLINLTFPTVLDTDLSLEDFYRLGRAPFKLMVPGMFTVFSPEPFVSISHGMIRSNPMKGTIDASIPDAADKLLGDEKEYFEHNTIVDLIRNDLSMVATGVKVERFRYLERISTNRKDLLQMSSEISGRLPAGHMDHLGEILFTLLPAGSVSGAPKKKTVAIIREAEPVPRGFYTGVFGMFDGKEFHSAVMIRFVELGDGILRFRSGGGITALSDCESEYRELNDKVYVPAV